MRHGKTISSEPLLELRKLGKNEPGKQLTLVLLSNLTLSKSCGERVFELQNKELTCEDRAMKNMLIDIGE